MEYTLTGAAMAKGLGKTTIHRALKSGKLSSRRLDDGSWRINGAKLARAFPPVPVEKPRPSPWNVGEQDGRAAEGPETGGGLGEAERIELAELRVEARMLRDDRDDLRRRLDEEREEQLALQRRLAPPAQERPQEAEEVVEDLRKRLEGTEAWIAALTVPERPQEAQRGAAVGAMGLALGVLGAMARDDSRVPGSG